MGRNRRIEFLKSAQEPSDIVRHLRYNGLSNQILAYILGVTNHTAYCWGIGRMHCDRVEGLKKLQTLVIVLREGGLTEEGVSQWLFAKNRRLNGITPIKYLADKNYDSVIEAAKAFAEGSYI